MSLQEREIVPSGEHDPQLFFAPDILVLLNGMPVLSLIRASFEGRYSFAFFFSHLTYSSSPDHSGKTITPSAMVMRVRFRKSDGLCVVDAYPASVVIQESENVAFRRTKRHAHNKSPVFIEGHRKTGCFLIFDFYRDAGEFFFHYLLS